MSKRKIRFNFVDLLILCVIGLAVLVVLYFFVWDKQEEQAPETEKVTIEYVIEIQRVDETKDISKLMTKDQILRDAVTKTVIGTLDSVEPAPMKVVSFDYSADLKEYTDDRVAQAVGGVPGNAGKTAEPSEVYAEVEGKMNLYLTVSAQAVESDRSFSINNYEIRVGQQVSVLLPDFQGYGYCIDLKKVG